MLGGWPGWCQVCHITGFHDFRLPAIEMSDPCIDAVAGSERINTLQSSQDP